VNITIFTAIVGGAKMIKIIDYIKYFEKNYVFSFSLLFFAKLYYFNFLTERINPK